MNKVYAFCIGAAITSLTFVMLLSVKGTLLVDFDLTTIILYWYFMYILFHDKKKDE